MDWGVRKFFLKYIVLFSIVISIPFFTLGFIINAYYLKYIEQTAITQNNNNLKKAIVVFDNEIDQLRKAAIQLNSKKELFSEELIKNAPVYESIISVIQNVKGMNNFIDEIVFYNYNVQKTVWTTKGTFNNYYYASYIDSKLNNRSYGASFYRNNNKYLYKDKIKYSSEGSSDTIEYAIELPKVNGIISFGITKKTLDDIFTLPTEQDRVQIYIYDSHGRNIYNIGNQSLSPKLRQNILNNNSNVLIDSVEDDFIFKQISDSSGLTYMSIISKSFIYKDVQYYKNIFILASLFIILIGGLLIYYFTKLNYTPLKNLYDFALTKVDKKTFSSGMDMVEKVQHTIYTLDDNAKMKEKEQKLIMKERLLLKLFQGGYKNAGDFNQSGEELGIMLTASRYRVLVITYMNDTTNTDKDDMTFTSIENVLAINYEVFGIKNIDQNQYILLIAYDDIDGVLSNRSIEMIYSVVSAANYQKMCLGIGNECSTVSDIFRSYIQASHAAKYSVMAENNIVFYDSLDAQNTIQYSYPKAELESLYNAIISRNVLHTNYILSTLINMISDCYQNMFLVICLCGDIFSTVMKAVNDLDSQYGKQCFNKIKSIDITNFRTLPELINSINWIKGEVQNLIEEYNRQSNTIEIAAILSYIQQNCSQYDLTVNSVADRFAVTPSNLSHQFKAQNGYNISDYINKVKMNYAKNLLAIGDMTIYEIAQKVGYSQPSSFIRKFKQFENVTPGEYKRSLQMKSK